MAQLFFASFVMLFTETMAIRWLGIEIPVFRAFPNLVLMIAFIGASAGISQPEKKPAPLKVALSIIFLLVSVIVVPHTGLKDMSLRLDGENSLPTVLLSIFTITVNAYCLLTLFQSIGVVVGDAFARLPALKTYAVNILGSMLGVLGFALCSFFSAPPWVWLAAATAGAWGYIRKWQLLALMLPLVVATFFSTQGAFWSPYGKLQVNKFEVPATSIFGQGNFMLFCNNVYFHLATHSPAPSEFNTIAAQSRDGEKQRLLYIDYIWRDLPYRFARAHDDLLVLGSGSGNDIAFAINRPVKTIDAVEIDPVIGEFGKTLHPDKPYLDKRLSLKINDARSYLRETAKKYDIVDFSCLDPGGTLNTASFLRVDNFVYTVEAMQDALRCLKPGGIVAMSFATGPEHPITARLYNTIAQAWGKEPLSLVDKTHGSCIFLFGPGIEQLINNGEAQKTIASVQKDAAEFVQWQPDEAQQKLRACFDDWPFLYLQFDQTGLLIYSIVLLITVLVPVLIMFKGGKQMLNEPEAFSMFFLGEAFMLMETKSCTQLSLIYGNTWLVSSVVIFTILSLSFLGNLYVIKARPTTLKPFYAAIILTCLLDFGWASFAHHLHLPEAALKPLSTIFVCLPVMFGGILFSQILKSSAKPNICFAANLLGVTFGGLLENLCVVSGIRSLSFLAMALYLFSAIPLIKKAPATLIKEDNV